VWSLEAEGGMGQGGLCANSPQVRRGDDSALISWMKCKAARFSLKNPLQTQPQKYDGSGA